MTTLSEQLREALSVLRKGAPGWGVAKDILARVIPQIEVLEAKAPPAPAKNELFKKLCKLGTPINSLIGAARSAEGLHKHHHIRKEWEDGLLKYAEEAKDAWDGIIALVESLEAPPAPVVDANEALTRHISDKTFTGQSFADYKQGFFDGFGSGVKFK